MSKLENKENKAKKTKKTVAKTVKAVKKAKTKTIEPTVVDEKVFSQRLHKHYDELKWLYCELYQDDKQPFAYFDELMKKIKEFYIARPNYLKELDIKREQQPDWYKGNKLLGMMMYVNSFSGTLKNFEKRLPYIQESNVNYLHLMPLLSSPKGKSDGGYAVADFRSVQEELGTMKARDRAHDLPELGRLASAVDRDSPACAFLPRCCCRKESCAVSVEYACLSDTHFVRCVL